ncbi:MAG: winged helix-turn-helix transcriptional regulator [Pseudomonadales bacterium]
MITPDKDCPTRRLMTFISDKWIPGIIFALSDGPHRTGELSRRLPSISKKMMTQTLRNLEAWGMVRRKVFHQVPPKVEYSLTAVGRKFAEPLALLCEWAEANEAFVRRIDERRKSS